MRKRISKGFASLKQQSQDLGSLNSGQTKRRGNMPRRLIRRLTQPGTECLWAASVELSLDEDTSNKKLGFDLN